MILDNPTHRIVMTTINSRLQSLETAERAERLRHDYCFCTDIWRNDPGRFRAFAALFAENGTWDDGDEEGPISGRERMADKLARLPETFGLCIGIHYVANPLLSIQRDGVETVWQMICVVQALTGKKPGFVAGRYVERYCYQGDVLAIASNVTAPAFLPAPAQLDTI
jgi:SnoaL-like domain